jgi:subtilisin family serine protease
MSPLRQSLSAAVVLALGVSSFDAFAARLDPRLQNLVATTAQPLEVIVTFNDAGAPSPASLAKLQALGLKGVTLRSLPMAAVVATPDQVRTLAADPQIKSVYWNAPLAWDNAEATELTGVDRLRRDAALRNASGLPYTGKGVTVLVNDTGVDGTHGDLQFGSHVVQNVAAQTNLRAQDTLLPVTYTEDVPNTDLGGGHGTHVAGIIGGTGASGSPAGLFEGVAPGANIVGYGSGAALFILDTLGGFDYALTNQARYGIRVVANSFGSTSDVCTPFDPADPTNIATKAMSDRGMIVVNSAGNSGAGECTITGNFKKAPWIVTVASGDKQGRLNEFSSRGAALGASGGSVEVDGETFTWSDRPTITSPGSGIYSARDSLGDPSSLAGFDAEAEEIGANNALFYTKMSGTSMASPHVSGIIALMLEANPRLGWREVKAILQETATNVPGMEPWEGGAGYVNAHAAVRAAKALRQYPETVNALRSFNANAKVSLASDQVVPVAFSPAGAPADYSFEVAAGVSLILAGANVGENTVAISLTDPNGVRYGSSIALPVIGQNIGVSAPGVPGTWKLSVRGIGSVSGVDVDPANATNGYGLPGTVDVRLKQVKTEGFTGLRDVASHPARGFIENAVYNRLADSDADGKFKPDAFLTRGKLAEFLVMGAGIRQPAANPAIADVPASDPRYGFAAAVLSRGGALRDLKGVAGPVMLPAATGLDGNRAVTREELAYSLVQSFGLETEAKAFTGDVTVVYGTGRVPVEDAASIAAGFKGYAQYALDMGLIVPRFELKPVGFGLPPKVVAYFDPRGKVTRAMYAFSATRYVEAIGQPAE